MPSLTSPRKSVYIKSMDWLKEFPQEKYLELIRSGKVEDEALEEINSVRPESKRFHPAVVVQLQVKRPAYRESVEEAKRYRADVWFNEIAKSANKTIEKDAVPAEKLKFEQRKYLAAIDNPDRYSEKVSHKLDVNVNIFQEMKDLPQREVQRLLKASDPFIEAEYVEVESESEEDILS